ncbi:MAG TPA: protein kinase [Vicinamibacterales bacterium]|nr:protein kinase [Vicinamibacterales bacterium]
MIDVSVVDGPTDKEARGPLRALYNWLTGATPPPQPPIGGAPGSTPRPAPARLGHYKILRTLGSGGMGVVYEARDERLERAVALKTMSVPANEETARKRFWREARAAAGVNHPNVCQVYEIGEDQGELFIAMELLEGESLADRLGRGPVGLSETTSIGLGMLAALSALHARGIVHRDLKPSNVFLTPHGVKLLDFGLARPAFEAALDHTKTELTRAGAMLGTPRYMAPEQVTGEEIDSRTDLFSAAAILFEMLSGRPAFVGRTVIEILHATVYEHPPALSGSPAVAALDRVIRHALAKKPADRPESADAMSNELAALRAASDDDLPAVAQALTRLVVLPFRVLRFDPETDFLAFSLPDAITTSLTGIGSLVVRSSATAAKFATEAPDLKVVAADADVDRVVTGTLLRSGDQLRVVAQLVEAPTGTLITSHTVQAPLGDLFRLQDDLARQIVGALSLPLGRTPAVDAPQNASAYELYLRANELARTYEKIVEARALYERCVELDPMFAPAWARLGRCYRVIDKYIEHTPDASARAEAALRRALELNPRLSVAHKFLSNFEADTGKAQQAVVRLLGEATRHGNDSELFAGLVQACRYAGLYDESIAAHAEARRLDPNIPTSVEQSILMTADFGRVLSWPEPATGGGGDGVIRVIALGMAGRLSEALEGLAVLRRAPHIKTFQDWGVQLQLWLERDPNLFANLGQLRELSIFEDPEATFQTAWMLADAGHHQRSLEPLRRAIDKGYFAAQTMERAPQFDALRGDPTFAQILADAERGRAQALAAFRDAGGDRLLGR